MSSDGGSDREAVIAAYDRLDAALDEVASLNWGRSAPERLALLHRLETHRCRRPSIEHSLIHGLVSQLIPADLGFEKIVVTDTIPLRPGAPENIQVLSCADLLTDSIRRIFTDDSVSEVFGGENQLF